LSQAIVVAEEIIMDVNNSEKKKLKSFNSYFLQAFAAVAVVHTAITGAAAYQVYSQI